MIAPSFPWLWESTIIAELSEFTTKSMACRSVIITLQDFDLLFWASWIKKLANRWTGFRSRCQFADPHSAPHFRYLPEKLHPPPPDQLLDDQIDHHEFCCFWSLLHIMIVSMAQEEGHLLAKANFHGMLWPSRLCGWRGHRDLIDAVISLGWCIKECSQGIIKIAVFRVSLLPRHQRQFSGFDKPIERILWTCSLRSHSALLTSNYRNFEVFEKSCQITTFT